MDTGAVLELLQDVADRVIDPRFRALTADEVHEKQPGDLVTVADRQAEAEITAALRKAYPHAVMLGEEAHAADRRLMGRFAQADHAFVIDPIDGTHNFVHGSPDHAVMVAELRGGQVVRAWVWQPQHRSAVVAERGAGAWRDGQRLPVLAPDGEPSAWRIHTSRRELVGVSLDGLPEWHPTWWSCGVDYPHLSAGGIDALLYRHGMPWDHAPGLLLLAETGGHIGLVDGSEYEPARPDLVVEAGGLIAAAGRDVYRRVVSALAGAGPAG